MNAIRQTQNLNKRELENAVSTEASWHADYRDTAYIYIGGLPFDLSEGDIVTIFSQYGEPVHVNLVRDKETGKSKGFAFLKYEDQRSTDLAVDNLGGATIMGRMLRVDHTRYKRKDDEEVDDNVKEAGETNGKGNTESKSEDEEPRRPLLKEERELAELMKDHDEEDPMKAYLIQEKREEVEQALAKIKKHSHRHKTREEKPHRHRHRRPSNERSRSRERKHRHRDMERSEDRPGRSGNQTSKTSETNGRERYRSESRDTGHHPDRGDYRR